MFMARQISRRVENASHSLVWRAEASEGNRENINEWFFLIS